jgi:hypothetical protein
VNNLLSALGMWNLDVDKDSIDPPRHRIQEI